MTTQKDLISQRPDLDKEKQYRQDLQAVSLFISMLLADMVKFPDEDAPDYRNGDGLKSYEPLSFLRIIAMIGYYSRIPFSKPYLQSQFQSLKNPICQTISPLSLIIDSLHYLQTQGFIKAVDQNQESPGLNTYRLTHSNPFDINQFHF